MPGKHLNQEKSSHHLIFGGMRSGKSLYAEQLALQSGLKLVYIATAQAFDEEMAQRIVIHKDRRGALWQSVEEPLDIGSVIARYDKADCMILVDCLTLWLNNLMEKGSDIDQEVLKLKTILEKISCGVIFVSNEVGLGIIPPNKLARSFGDAQGKLNQDMAQICDEVTFIAAGLPLKLK